MHVYCMNGVCTGTASGVASAAAVLMPASRFDYYYSSVRIHYACVTASTHYEFMHVDL